MQSTAKKSRSWWFVQLIENLPDDWQSQLYECVIPGCYIIHDKDEKRDDESGELRPVKPHVHCLLEFGSPVRIDTVLNAIPDSFGVSYAEPVPTKVGAYRYMLHLGYEGKYEYSRDDMHHLHGFKVDLSEVCNIGFQDVYNLIEQMQIENFASLLSFLVEFKPDYLDYVTKHVNLVKSYIYERSKLVS